VALSTHYFVLSLGKGTSTLTEAFRDVLIDVENQGFPIHASSGTATDDPEELRALARTADVAFGRHHSREPLRLVVVGDAPMQAAFDAVTTHGAAIIGRIRRDHTVTDSRQLGRLVWPVVKEALSGVVPRALRTVEEFRRSGRLVAGIDAVARHVRDEIAGTILVEDDYHLRGHLTGAGRSPAILPEVDVRDVTDDAVDAVIDSHLRTGGHVVFTPPDALRQHERIVLLQDVVAL